MIVYEQRGSTILYNIITSINNDKPFLIPSNVCPIVISVFLKANRKFDLIDISEHSLCIDEKLVLELIKNNQSKYAGVLFVRSYGITDSFEDLFNSIKNINDNILIIDDKCIAPPSFDDKPIYADVNLYSTGYSKYVDLGWGAFANCKDTTKYTQHHLIYKAEHLQSLNTSFRNSINKRETFKFDLISNGWLDTSIPALAFEDYKILVLQSYTESKVLKEKFNDKYSSQLPRTIQLDKKYQNWRFNVIVPAKEILLAKIFNKGYFASSHFAPSSMIFYRKESRNSDALYSKIINLFSDKLFPFSKTDEVISIINKHVNQYK
jgi:hypothetical protein